MAHAAAMRSCGIWGLRVKKQPTTVSLCCVMYGSHMCCAHIGSLKVIPSFPENLNQLTSRANPP